MVHVEDHNTMIQTSQSQKTTQLLSILQAPKRLLYYYFSKEYDGDEIPYPLHTL